MEASAAGEIAQPGAAPVPAAVEPAGSGPGGTGGGASPSLTRFYAYRLVTDASLTGGIWILYLHDRGMSLAAIGQAEACFHLAPITLELPSGSLADVAGRKWSLVIGSLLIAASAALLLAAPSPWAVLPAMYLGGASYAFRSGAQEAFLYDTLGAGPGTDRFAPLLGRLLAASYLVIAATTWVGGVLADSGFTWPYLLTIGIGLVGAWLAAGLREPPRARPQRQGMVRTMATASQILRRQPLLAALIGFTAGLWTLLTLIGLYAQAVLSEQGLAPSTIGLIIGATLLCTALGSWLAGRVTSRGRFSRWTMVVTAAIVAAGLGLGSGVLLLAVPVYLLAEFAAGLYEPLLSARINDEVAATHRATILSVQGFLFSLTMIWAFPLTGWLAERGGWLLAYASAGLIVLVLLAGWLLLNRDQVVDTPPR